MSDPRIKCPECGGDVPLTESLAGPLLERTRAEAEARQRDALAAQKAAIETAAAEAAAQAQGEKLAQMAEAAAARDAEVAEMKRRETAREAKLAEAQKAQAEAMRRAAALAEREREMELEIEKKVGAATEVARQKLAQQAEALAADRLQAAREQEALKLAEKDQQMEVLRRQIEVLTRKVEQGSQQRQGEAAEVVLEDQLGRAFPMDSLEPVGKGVRGADCLQRVPGAGAIIWESKRTANWSDGWLPKLREDMRAAGADVAVIVSEARPEGCDSFAFRDGVWVSAPRYAVALSRCLREGLLRVAEARGAREGQATKTEMLYEYVTSGGMRARLEAAIEPFDAMEEALAKEQRHMTAQWATRRKQIDKARDAMAGMYGDIQGIAGASVMQIEAFETPLLEGDA